MPQSDDRRIDTPRIKPGISGLAQTIVRHERVFDVLSTIVTALFTVVLAVSTVFLWRETRDLRNFAQIQSEDMKASIAEAARAATAMQNVADSVAASARAADQSLAVFKDANARQMRAYLTVGLGGVINQDKATNYQLEVRMTLQNTGNTPAYKVRSITQIDILPTPLPNDFALPTTPLANGASGVLAPHQNFVLTAIADKMYSDEDINEIQFGTRKQLYVFGTVIYEDAFGVQRRTSFCQRIAWLKGGGFLSFNTADYNDPD